MWRDRLAWTGRLDELGTVFAGDDGAYIQTAIPTDSPLAEAWRKLPRMPLFVEALPGGAIVLQLRYAALDGAFQRSRGRRAATLGLQLARALRALVEHVPLHLREPFAHPRAYVDVAEHARLAFAEPDEDHEDCTEAGLVSALGAMLLDLAQPDDPLCALAKRCEEYRVRDLAAARELLLAHGGWEDPIELGGWRSWLAIERAIGFAVIGDRDGAMRAARAAVPTYLISLSDQLLAELANLPLPVRVEAPPPPEPPPPPPPAPPRPKLIPGSSDYRTLPIPEHLRELSPLFAQGRLLDAILWLTDRYADPAARALLAVCYEYAEDPESALHVYLVDGDPAGEVRCLAALGRHSEALARAGDAADLRELARGT